MEVKFIIFQRIITDHVKSVDRIAKVQIDKELLSRVLEPELEPGANQFF